MNTIEFRDNESIRQQRNRTHVQNRNNSRTKEGVIVNSFVKDGDKYIPAEELSLENAKNQLIIPDKVSYPEKLAEDSIEPGKSLLPISAVAIGVMGLFAGISCFIKRNARITNEIAKEKWISSFTRNISINEETVQAIIQMVQNPNKKTIRAGVGVLTLTATAFMGKTFFDGFKEVWVKKKEADIQKNLQERLIDIETQSFSGKMQIVRKSLSDTAYKFSKYLSPSKTEEQPFGMFKSAKELTFGQKSQERKDNKFQAFKYLLLGLATVVSIIGLSAFSMKNLQAAGKETQKFVEKTKADINFIAGSRGDRKYVKEYLERMMEFISAKEEFIREAVSKTDWSEPEKEEFIKKVAEKIKTSTVKVNPNIGGDGTQKPSFSSFVDDYRAFFYNFLIEPDNKQFQQLFFGTTALTAIGYGGKLLGDAIKEVEVKKNNAKTELRLQQNLISIELRNFKAKKDAAIAPLIQEFYRQVDAGKSPEELKELAENILHEIKNGPPFVYS